MPSMKKKKKPEYKYYRDDRGYLHTTDPSKDWDPYVDNIEPGEMRPSPKPKRKKRKSETVQDGGFRIRR